MKARDEIGVLFLLDDLLELERKPTDRKFAEWSHIYYKKPYSRVISLLSDSTTSYRKGYVAHIPTRQVVLTLMIMTRVDWNRVGFAAGSKTDALDWKDWKRPLMSLLNAKLLRKSTYSLSEKGRR
jgi:hypothetical protein